MFNDAVEQTASPLSREAATECSPRRKPWEKWEPEKPQRGERLALTHTLQPLRSLFLDALTEGGLAFGRRSAFSAAKKSFISNGT